MKRAHKANRGVTLHAVKARVKELVDICSDNMGELVNRFSDDDRRRCALVLVDGRDPRSLRFLRDVYADAGSPSDQSAEPPDPGAGCTFVYPWERLAALAGKSGYTHFDSDGDPGPGRIRLVAFTCGVVVVQVMRIQFSEWGQA